MRLSYLSLWQNEEDGFVHLAHDAQETSFNSGALLYLTPYRNLAAKPIVQLFDVSLGRGAMKISPHSCYQLITICKSTAVTII